MPWDPLSSPAFRTGLQLLISIISHHHALTLPLDFLAGLAFSFEAYFLEDCCLDWASAAFFFSYSAAFFCYSAAFLSSSFLRSAYSRAFCSYSALALAISADSMMEGVAMVFLQLTPDASS